MEDGSVDSGSKAKKVNDKNFGINKYFRKEFTKPTFLLERFQSYKSIIIIIHIFVNFKFILAYSLLGVGLPASSDLNKKSNRFTPALTECCVQCSLV